MDLNLDNIDHVSIEAAYIGPFRLKASITGASEYDILSHFAMHQIIDYFGIENILDEIGEDECIVHFNLGREEEG